MSGVLSSGKTNIVGIDNFTKKILDMMINGLSQNNGIGTSIEYYSHLYESVKNTSFEKNIPNGEVQKEEEDVPQSPWFSNDKNSSSSPTKKYDPRRGWDIKPPACIKKKRDISIYEKIIKEITDVLIDIKSKDNSLDSIMKCIYSKFEKSSEYAIKCIFLQIIASNIIANHVSYCDIQLFSFQKLYNSYIDIAHKYELGEFNVVPDILNKIKSLKSDMKSIDINKYCETRIVGKWKLILDKPSLLNTHMYSKYQHLSNFKPNDNQEKLFKVIEDLDVKTGTLVMESSATSSGKTTSIVKLVDSIETRKKNDPAFKHVQVLVCCELDLVRTNIVSMLKAVDKSFTIASIDPNGQVVHENMSSNIAAPVTAIVCDAQTGAVILQTDSSYTTVPYSRFILVLDECTMGAIENNSNMKHNVDLMLHSTFATILMSASLPCMEDTYIMKRMKLKYPELNVIDIVSHDAKTGCTIMTDLNTKFVPNRITLDSMDSGSLGDYLLNYPFIKRIFSYEMLYGFHSYLDEKIAKSHIDVDMGEFEKYVICALKNIVENVFVKNKNINYNNITDTFKELFAYCFTYNNIIEDVCNIPITSDIVNDVKNDHGIDILNFVKLGDIIDYDTYESDIIDTIEDIINEGFGYIKTDDTTSFDAKKIGTCQAHYFSETTIVAHKDPTRCMDDFFGELYADVLKYLVESKQVHLDSDNNPVMYDPSRFYQIKSEHIINSKEHCMKYSLGSKNIKYRDFSTVCNNGSIKDMKLKIMLQCGVAISPDNVKDQGYKNKVKELLNENKLAFLIADESFAYGANYSLTNMIVGNYSFNESPSMNIMIQLFGRIGRFGKSERARVMLDRDTNDIQQILSNYILYGKYEDIELKNIKQYAIDSVEKQVSKYPYDLLGLISSGKFLNMELNELQHAATRSQNLKSVSDVFITKNKEGSNGKTVKLNVDMKEKMVFTDVQSSKSDPAVTAKPRRVKPTKTAHVKQ